MQNFKLILKSRQITAALILNKMSDQRLIEIESKIAYQDDTILQLNDVLCKQQDQIDRLDALTQQLLGRVRDLSENSAGGASEFSAMDERPPHY